MVGEGRPCFIIAELSGNHHQKYEEAEALVQAAAAAGADAVKLQTYTPDTITLKSNKKWFLVEGKDQPDEWKGKTLWDLYQQAYTPWEWQPKLKKLADELGMVLFSSPFDETAVDFLEREVNPPCYKVASYEAVHIPLIRRVAKTHKPVIISIGFASQEEAELAVKTLHENGCQEIAMLHCVTSYSDKPAWEYTNLRTIGDIAQRFGVVAGFSDNNAGIELPVLAVAVAGASVVEKHLTLDRKLGGPDAQFSIEPHEFKRMVELIRKGEKGESVLSDIGISQEQVEKAMGQVHYGPASPAEEANKEFRPSIWVQKPVKKGELFTQENIRVARPGAGLLPKYWDEVLGKRAACDIEEATPLTQDLIEGLGVSLRKATPEDLMFYFELRNDPSARTFQFNTESIDLATHKAWFSLKLQDVDTRLFVIEKEGEKIGQVRVDLQGSAGEIHIALVPSWRGKGYAPLAIRQAVSQVFQERAEVRTIDAHIKESNAASQKSFERAGFQSKGRTTFRGNECIRMTYERMEG